MDEPFTGLDPAGASALETLLAECRTAGRVVVLVTHDVPRGLRLSDRVAVMQRGRVALVASASDCTVESVNQWFSATPDGAS